MIDLFYNPLFLLTLMFLLFIVIILVLLKLSKDKVKEKKEVATETVSKEEKKSEQEIKPEEEIKPQRRVKGISKKKSVQRVFQPKTETLEKEPVNKFTEITDREEEFLKKMQFVNINKNVSKLTRVEVQEPEPEEVLETQEQLPEDQPKVEVSPKKYGDSFNRSRRILKMVEQDNFDNMFASHIKDDYLNINSNRHLNIDDSFEEKLYHRASSTLANSFGKVVTDPEHPENNRPNLSEIEQRRREELSKLLGRNSDDSNAVKEVLIEDEEFNLSARNFLIIDALTKRKGRSSY